MIPTLRRAVLVLPLLAFAACSDSSSGNGPKGPLTLDITLEPPDSIMRTSSADYRVIGGVLDADQRAVANRAVTLTSTDPAVVSVDSSGFIIGRALGTARIVARSGDLVDTSRTITVYALYRTALLAGPTGGTPDTSYADTATVSLTTGESLTLSAKMFDDLDGEIAGRTFTYSSSDEAKATVTNAGVVTALAPTAASAPVTITVHSTAPDGTVTEDTIDITVVPPAP